MSLRYLNAMPQLKVRPPILEASEAQKEALAKRLNVSAVDALSAQIVLERTAGHVITVNGCSMNPLENDLRPPSLQNCLI